MPDKLVTRLADNFIDAALTRDWDKIAEAAVLTQANLWFKANRAIDQDRRFLQLHGEFELEVARRARQRPDIIEELKEEEMKRKTLTEGEIDSLVEETVEATKRFAFALTWEEFEKADYETQSLSEKLRGVSSLQAEEITNRAFQSLEGVVPLGQLLEVKRRYTFSKMLREVVGEKEKKYLYSDMEQRQKLAKEITAMIKPVLERDIAKAVEDALSWRKPKMLKKLKRAVGEGGKPVTVKGRESCVFLKVGEEVIMLG